MMHPPFVMLSSNDPGHLAQASAVIIALIVMFAIWFIGGWGDDKPTQGKGGPHKPLPRGNAFSQQPDAIRWCTQCGSNDVRYIMPIERSMSGNGEWFHGRCPTCKTSTRCWQTYPRQHTPIGITSTAKPIPSGLPVLREDNVGLDIEGD